MNSWRLMMDFSRNYSRLLAQVEAWIAFEVSRPNHSPTLWPIAEYALMSGGKRLRPVLALAIAEMLSVPAEKVREFCLSLEFLHVSSLVHDDLPALDNDDQRRGLPSCHIQFSEAEAVLAGDLLITRAFGILARGGEQLESQERVGLENMLASAYEKLCEGQALDLRGAACSVEQLETIYALKTGALFDVAVLGPASLNSEMSTESHVALQEFSRVFGLLFQLTDDVLDYGQDQKAESDEPNYSRLVGPEKTATKVQELKTTAEQALAMFGDKSSFIRGLLVYVCSRLG